ncbi:hypothetical protein PHK61_07675 [Actinomycetospora lutea]|uniref:DUF7714 family protein n=1 Tax=Actinomycetospora lutea TaxID=663604 RepID=UPI0023661F1A|nr:hypothetical protein [Actinomycetospora lutea]MDD7938295.1 hypothetical protein [Actinomycetospora lutea]
MTANLVPGRYRGVAVARAPLPYDEATLRERYLGREAYWKTRFLVVRPPDTDHGPVALLAVARAGDDELFSPIVEVTLLAGPDETVLLHRPELDTGVPTLLAAAAAEVPEARAVVVQGRYEHVNFILDARPLPVTVREVVPPRPAKLADQARRVLEVSEDLPPMALTPHTVDLAELAAAHPAAHYLLPCRGGGGEVPGAAVSYLDERPPEADWTLLGCERSRQIHRWFYGREAPGVDTCPLAAVAAEGAGAVLTKCCLQQEELAEGTVEGPDGATRWVSVPWGSSLEHVREALARLAQREEPRWSPA